MKGFKKYSNKKTEVDNIFFASIAESKRYLFLKNLLALNLITELELQPTFELLSKNNKKICKYKADFRYKFKDKIIVEDVKGALTPVYKLKRTFFLAEYPELEFFEVKYRNRKFFIKTFKEVKTFKKKRKKIN